RTDDSLEGPAVAEFDHDRVEAQVVHASVAVVIVIYSEKADRGQQVAAHHGAQGYPCTGLVEDARVGVGEDVQALGARGRAAAVHGRDGLHRAQLERRAADVVRPADTTT